MTQITFGGNFFIGGKSAEFNPFSTVSQVIRFPMMNWPALVLDLGLTVLEFGCPGGRDEICSQIFLKVPR
jgi:hypothetical protein